MSRKRKQRQMSLDTRKRIAHVKERAIERTDIRLTNEDIYKIGKMIRTGRSSFIKAMSRTRTKHCVKYKGEDLVVMYHKGKKIPVTILEKRNNNGHKTQPVPDGDL